MTAEPRAPSWKQLLKICAGLVTLLSVVFALEEGYRIWSEHRTEAAALRERVATARTLVGVGDYDAAWEVLTEAQHVYLGSEELRAAQIDVAATWLLEGFSVAEGWVPSGSAGDTVGRSPGEVAEVVHTPLVVATVLARGEERADLEALVTWADFLRGRELFTSRRDLGPELRDAREIAPGAFAPNLLLGYWQAAFEGEPQGALQSWNRALAGDAADRDLVRRFQASVLGAGIEDEERGDAYRRALLTVLDEMERGGETVPHGLRLSDYLRVYVDPRGRELYFDAVADALEPERHLAVLEWVGREFGIEPDEYATTFESVQFIRANLLERAGRRDEALQAMSHPGIDLRNAFIAERFDETFERLAGHPPPDVFERDEWRGHVHHLTHGRPGEARFDTAMAALREWADTWDRVGDSLLDGKLPPALDAAVAAWEREAARSDLSDPRRRDAEDTLRFLHLFRGHVRADMYDFEGGIAELEALVGDPATPRAIRAEALFALAGAYAHSPRMPYPEFITGEPGQRIYEAYLYEALDRLAAAVDAGLDDWDRIEAELPRLRELPEYQPFSLRHGRVPPTG